MKLRNRLNGCEYEAALSTEHAASSHGQAVLVDAGTGEAVDQFSALVTEIVEATDDERTALQDAGYSVAGAAAL